MGRAPCCDKVGVKKGPWTPEEDLKLIQHIQTHGPGNWRTLPKNAGLQRCGKSCRLRWTNYLRPDIKRGRFSFEEEETIIQLHSVLGNKWSAIAARLPGRTDNEVKNYWNTHIRKRLLRSGIDPVTHGPRLDLLDLSSILSSSFRDAGLINLTNLLSAQALVNPQLLKLASTLSLLKQANPELYLQTLRENQVQSSQIPSSSSNLVPNQTELLSNVTNFGCPISQDLMMVSSFGNDLVSQPNNGYCSNTNDLAPDQLDFLSQINNLNQNFSHDSVKSTPSSSSTPLNSASMFMNSSTEDERDSYCSNLLKFEVPEGFDVGDFL